MITLCTAGHIDHGKSTLVKCLTSIDPDRLPEEKNRGMTIDLGFAWMPISTGEVIGIVDIPGHKHFIGNVIPGMSSADGVILVIAADDGWMPQTEEHVQILDMLGIKHGIVALTKIDLVDDPEWLAMVETDISLRLAQTSLKDAPIIKVSTKNSIGITELREAINQLALKITPNADIGKARLPIDRVFIVKGSGVVVTGTLKNGSLSCNDEIVILPAGLKANIRSIESYKKRVVRALPGSRVALNLGGLKKTELKRGDVILARKTKAGRLVDAEVRVVGQMNKIKNNAEFLVYMETSELPAKLILIGSSTDDGTKTFFVQLQFRDEVAAYIGEHFILRDPSADSTVGGGVILDPLADRYRAKDADRLFKFLKRRRDLNLEELILTEAEKLKYAKRDDFLEASLYSSADIISCVDRLINEGKLIGIDSYIIDVAFWQEQAGRFLEALSQEHGFNPLGEAVPQAKLMAYLALPEELFQYLILEMVEQGKIVRSGDSVALSTHKPRLSSNQEELISIIQELFAENPANPLTLQELTSKIPDSEEVIHFMCRQNILVELPEGVLFDAKQYQHIRKKVIAFLEQNGRISIQDLRSLTGFSRKYLLPILLSLDREGITRREGDVRILYSKGK